MMPMLIESRRTEVARTCRSIQSGWHFLGVFIAFPAMQRGRTLLFKTATMGAETPPQLRFAEAATRTPEGGALSECLGQGVTF
jgi:hypothetical protein